jgi:tRNA A-37 threonylcarbamoyl transferase component Bud32
MSGVFGRYELLDRIGIGGMAEVFRARAFGAEGFQKTLVLKKILPHLSDDPRFQAMFVDEAKISVALQHANIVQVFDLGRIDDQLFIAMELVEGDDLVKTLRAAEAKKLVPLPLDVCLYVIHETLKGLHYAHTRTGHDGRALGVIHRDVSPANILLSFAGEVKISDFGIAKAAQKTEHTRTGVIKGKIHFMPPEQLEAKPLDARADVYGVGMCMHTLLSGRHPFEGKTDLEVVDLIRTGEIVPPSSLNPDLPPELDRIVGRALTRVPTLRYESAEAFQDAVTQFADDNGIRLRARPLADLLRALFGDGMARAEEAAAQGASFVGQVVSGVEQDGLTILRGQGAAPAGSQPSVAVRSSESGQVSGAVPADPSLHGPLPTPGPMGGSYPHTPPPPSTPVSAVQEVPPAEVKKPVSGLWRMVGIGLALFVALSAVVFLARIGQESGQENAIPAGKGRVIVRVQPWADVWIDGKRQGSTPLQVDVSPGGHKVEYETPDGKRRSARITVQAGKVVELDLP